MQWWNLWCGFLWFWCGFLWLSRRKRWLPSKRSGVFFLQESSDLQSSSLRPHEWPWTGLLWLHINWANGHGSDCRWSYAYNFQFHQLLGIPQNPKWCKPPTFHQKQCARCIAVDAFWFAAGFHVCYPLSCSKYQSRTSNRFLCDTMHTLVESSNFRPCHPSVSPSINHPPSTDSVIWNSATYRVQTLSPASSQIPKWRVHHLRCQRISPQQGPRRWDVGMVGPTVCEVPTMLGWLF